MQLPYRGSGKVYFSAKEYRCDLYYSEKLGGIILKINTIDENTIGSFLQLPLEIYASRINANWNAELDSLWKICLYLQRKLSFGRNWVRRSTNSNFQQSAVYTIEYN